MTNLERACAAWTEAKEAEKAATESRRQIEDWMRTEIQVPDNFDGSRTMEIGTHKVKVTGRLTKKVDEKKLQEIAEKTGKDALMFSLFRWKAEINTAVWNRANPEVTAAFLPAITTKPGRVSFSIEKIEGPQYCACGIELNNHGLCPICGNGAKAQGA